MAKPQKLVTTPARRRPAGASAKGWSLSTGYPFAIFAFFVFFFVYRLIAPDVVYLPSTLNIFTLFAVLLLSLTIRNAYARAISFFWGAWFLLGSLSLFAQNQTFRGLNYNLDPAEGNQYYLCCIAAAVLAIRAAELTAGLRAPTRPVSLTRGSNVWVGLLLLIFPFLYAVSIVAATGDIPMFSGRDVSAQMYEEDYGPLHSFGVFVTVACILLWEKINDRASAVRRVPIRYFAMALLGLFLVIAAMDGRRALAVFALFGILLFSSAQQGKPGQRVQVVVMTALALLGYVVAATLRTGSDTSEAFAGIWEPLSTIGTEYRDFSYGFVRLSRSQVLAYGYDWLGSTVATLVPRGLLGIFGFDKAAIIQTDSARTLMDFWNVKLGIRIGLPGELWFAYGWWGVAWFAGFGLIVYGLAVLALRSSHFVYRGVMLALLGLFATSVLGQSTVTFGLVLPLIYLSIVVRLIEFTTKQRQQPIAKRMWT